MSTRILPATFVIALLLGGALAARERTPIFTVNEKIRLAQVGEKARVHVRYDVRPVGGQGLKLYLYNHRDDLKGEPRKEWYFRSPFGEERIHFNDLPIAVYKVVGVAVDGEGTPVAEPSGVVHVEYGGWRAWEEFQAPDLRAPAPPLTEVAPAGHRSADEPGLEISPTTVILRPQEVATFEARLHKLPPEEEIEWEVEDGDWERPEPHKLTLVAPEVDSGSRVIRVRAYVSRFPEIEASATVLVTTLSRGELP